jgi:hypothetical protein
MEHEATSRFLYSINIDINIIYVKCILNLYCQSIQIFL